MTNQSRIDPSTVSDLVQQAQQLASESLEKYRLIAENSADVIAQISLDGKRLYTSPSVKQLFGWTPEELLGHSQFEQFHPDDIPMLKDVMARLVSTGVPESPTYRSCSKDGKWLWVETSCTPIRDDAGKVFEIHTSTRDITQRRLDESALREREERLQLVLEAISDGVYDWNVATGLVYFSPAYFHMIGYEDKEFPSTFEAWRERIHPDDISDADQAIHAQFSNPASTPYCIEFRMRQKDGSWKWIRSRGRVVTVDQGGKPLRMVGTHTDISLRRKAEDQYRLLFENLTTGFALHEVIQDDSGKVVDYRFLEINPAFEKLTGLTTASMLGKTVQGALPGTEPYWIETYGKVALTGEPIRYENYAAAIQRWFEVWAYRPAPLQFAVIVSDITLRKQQEEALRKSEEKFRFLAENALDVVLRVDPKGNYLWISPSMKSVLDLDPEAIIGTSSFSTVHPDDLDRVVSVFKSALASSGLHKVTFRHRTNSGTWLWVESIGRSLLDPNSGEVTEVLISTRDISDRKAAESKIEELNNSLEQRVAARTSELELANQELESFSYSVSHDLRSPLRAIDGFSNALLEDMGPSLAPEFKVYLDRIRAASHHMGRLIDDLLELSRSIRVEIRKHDIDASAVAKEILDALQRQTPSRTLVQTIESGIHLVGDPVLVRSIFENLLGNAWKYSSGKPKSVIEVRSKVVDGRKWILISDNGAGFDMAHAGNLFGTFHRLHSSSQFEGTGIGLATVRKIVERHGGSVDGHGTLDQGAIFQFTLDPIGSNKP